ncbi:hypothetical protein [Elizabethkingia meningoseptica]|uniref:hypothetical protein n=1 Tax=Elizabethkingia meningoseptica TaxID=238 RepID=UPI0023AEEE83|nr:hypothetical protein [Elizabethkingia meningoseptica]MDE5526644.1 hypothetical protein [Elizabethkingia meningoseptica]
MKYKNPFHNPKYTGSKPEYEGENYIEYKGYYIFHSAKSASKYDNVHDVVKDGVLVCQRVTLNSCKEYIDQINKVKDNG